MDADAEGNRYTRIAGENDLGSDRTGSPFRSRVNEWEKIEEKKYQSYQPSVFPHRFLRMSFRAWLKRSAVFKVSFLLRI